MEHRKNNSIGNIIIPVMVVVLLAAGIAHAGDNVTTNYYTGYKYVAAAEGTNTVDDIGLATNTAYVCFPLATLTGLSETQAASTTGDVRAVVFYLLETFNTSRAASTNATATTIDRAAAYTTIGSNITESVVHSVKSQRTISAGTFE
jgi:hypothetical protein